MVLKQLWSPWRMEYILGEKTDGCVFCLAFLSDLPADKEHLILYRGQHCGVVMNLFPYNNGHLLIIPYEHQETFEGLSPDALLEVMALLNKSVAVLRESMNAEGFNVGVNLGKAAGAGIGQHVHLHIVPRWEGDTNFLTTLGGVRCIPESLEASYAKLKEVWDRALDECAGSKGA